MSVRKGLVVAPMRLRALAMLINLGVVVGGLATLVGAAIILVKAGGARRVADTSLARAVGRRLEARVREHNPQHTPAEPRRSTRARIATETLGVATAIRGRNARGPGQRALGLRTVDVRTGGPVSVRSALIALALRRARSQIVTRALGPELRRRAARQTDAAPFIRAAQDAHRGDPEAASEAMMAIYREHAVNPFATASLGLAGVLANALLDLPTLYLTGRTLRDLLAGTVLVLEDD